MNAVITGGANITTEYGYARQFGTNHMGRALLFTLSKTVMLNTILIPGTNYVGFRPARHRFGKKNPPFTHVFSTKCSITLHLLLNALLL